MGLPGQLKLTRIRFKEGFMSPAHYTKETTEAMYWCNTCGRETMHYVWDRRLANCKEHEFKGVNGTGMTQKQFKKKQQQEFEAKNPSLFGENK